MLAWEASMEEFELRRRPLDDDEAEDDGFTFDDDEEDEDFDDEDLDDEDDDLGDDEDDDLDDLGWEEEQDDEPRRGRGRPNTDDY